MTTDSKEDFMPLYTFIADYNGGTYISQVTATDSKAALLLWAQQLEIETISGLGSTSKAHLVEELRQQKDDVCSPLNGLDNMWCATLLVRGKLMLVHFVQTTASQSS